MGGNVPEVWDKYKNGHFLIVGFTERTGLSAARHFQSHDIPFSISDTRTEQELSELLSRFNSDGIKVFTGRQDVTQLGGVSNILLSPGVPRSIPLIQEAMKQGIPVQNDVDLIYESIQDKTIIAVTGTDGKTTTVSLIEHLINTQKKVSPVEITENLFLSTTIKYSQVTLSFLSFQAICWKTSLL
jgi:UDP-N-acetylmuramoylalanine--D-glutamate ligase